MLDSVIRDWLEPSPLRGPCILVTLELISQVSNASQNINFQKSSYQNRPVIEGTKP